MHGTPRQRPQRTLHKPGSCPKKVLMIKELTHGKAVSSDTGRPGFRRVRRGISTEQRPSGHHGTGQLLFACREVGSAVYYTAEERHQSLRDGHGSCRGQGSRSAVFHAGKELWQPPYGSPIPFAGGIVNGFPRGKGAVGAVVCGVGAQPSASGAAGTSAGGTENAKRHPTTTCRGILRRSPGFRS